jgi:hypothetical protein
LGITYGDLRRHIRSYVLISPDCKERNAYELLAYQKGCRSRDKRSVSLTWVWEAESVRSLEEIYQSHPRDTEDDRSLDSVEPGRLLKFRSTR